MNTEHKVIPDAGVREQVLTPGESYIVQAPAGSGKTTLLASRYVALLTQVARPEEILAITFTKKAAAEMRHRVLKMLAEDTPQAAAVNARDRELGWQIFTNPNVLKIQTIDSFALDVASQIPSLSQAAGLAITERAQPSYAAAATRLFNRLYSDDQTNPLVAQFLGFLDNDINRAIRLLSFMLARRDQWLTPVRAVATARGQNQTAELVAQAIQDIRRSLSEQLDAALKELEAIKKAEQKAVKENNQDGQELGILSTIDLDLNDDHSYTVNDDRFEVVTGDNNS